MARRFGPTNAPGTVIIERPGEKSIQPGELGVTVLTGITRMGPTAELIPCPTKKEFLRRCGGRIPKSLLPDVALEFFNMSGGAGELWIQRVTNGSEVNSTATLKDRSDARKDVVKINAQNGGKWGDGLSVVIDNGVIDPINEWSLLLLLDGEEVLRYERLSSDPQNPFYFERVINDDDNNIWITAQDQLSGAITTQNRPAFLVGDITSVANLTLTVEVDAPLEPGKLVGWFIIPDITKPNARFRIDANTANTITVAPGSDLSGLGAGQVAAKKKIQSGKTKGSAANVTLALPSRFMLVAPVRLADGEDGLDNLNSGHFVTRYDVDASLIKSLFGKNKGLVKLATPGVGMKPTFAENEIIAIHKAGLNYAEDKNYQYRIEIPPDKTTAQLALDYLYGNNGIGHSDFGVVSFPSWGSISDPEGAGLKQIPLTGSILGREAKVARDFQGYHKAAAGIDVVLSSVLKLPVELDENAIETLNPRGINAIKFYRGNVILWGDRTISSDPNWRWKHQREQMSYYENILRENFDWIIFMINDRILWRRALATLTGFFLPEWQPKRALRGDSFEEAAILKIDEENNTNASMASGELNAEIALRLADTVERFIITIGKRGIFEEILAAA